jgi:hypothetical protein
MAQNSKSIPAKAEVRPVLGAPMLLGLPRCLYNLVWSYLGLTERGLLLEAPTAEECLCATVRPVPAWFSENPDCTVLFVQKLIQSLLSDRRLLVDRVGCRVAAFGAKMVLDGSYLCLVIQTTAPLHPSNGSRPRIRLGKIDLSGVSTVDGTEGAVTVRVPHFPLRAVPFQTGPEIVDCSNAVAGMVALYNYSPWCGVWSLVNQTFISCILCDHLVTCSCISPDGALLLCGGDRGTVSVHSVRTGELLSQFQLDFGNSFPTVVSEIRLCGPGTLVASSEDSTRVLVYDLTRGVQCSLGTHRGWVSSMALSADRTILVTTCWLGQVKIWCTATWSCLGVNDLQTRVLCAAISSDGRMVACGSVNPGAIQILDRDKGYRSRGATLHETPPQSISFSPDSTLFGWVERSGTRVQGGKVHVCSLDEGVGSWSQEVYARTLQFLRDDQVFLMNCVQELHLTVWYLNPDNQRCAPSGPSLTGVSTMLGTFLSS